MRLLTLLALGTLAAGYFHVQQHRRGRVRAREARVDSDAELQRRIRAAIESGVSQPNGVQVNVLHGVVTLRGTVRRDERDFVLAAALGCPGVEQVNNLLDYAEAAGEVGPLQAGFATGP